MLKPQLQSFLVTGGAGFIGSNFVRFILKELKTARIVNLDLLTYAGNIQNLKGVVEGERYNFVKGDINDTRLVTSLLRKQHVDTVVNFAAETHVDRSILAPSSFVSNNVNGTFNLLEAVREYWSSNQEIQDPKFLHISTDEVFGSLEPEDPPFTEQTAYSPRSPYAATKAAGDHLVRAYFHTYKFPALIVNCSNNYGPYQYPEKLIPLALMNAVEGRRIPIYGDGTQIRDWLYVDDHCRALIHVLKHGQLGNSYNIGGNVQVTNLSVVKRICGILDSRIPNSPFRPHSSLIEFITDRPGHDSRYAMDITKISEELGWRPKEKFEDGLLKTITWYLENQEWMTSVSRTRNYKAWVTEQYEKRMKE